MWCHKHTERMHVVSQAHGKNDSFQVERITKEDYNEFIRAREKGVWASHVEAVEAARAAISNPGLSSRSDVRRTGSVQGSAQVAHARAHVFPRKL